MTPPFLLAMWRVQTRVDERERDGVYALVAPRPKKGDRVTRQGLQAE